MTGKLFIISAPSGTGKTSILKKVMEQVSNVVFSVSHTTRLPRQGERGGSDYYFVDEEQFREMTEDGAFLEWARVHGNFYGTAIAPIKKRLEQGHDVILDIDVQGADIVRREGRLSATYIFIAPPDLEELERRLRGRGTEDEASISRRLENGRTELAQSEKYDYYIINDVLDDAVAMMTSIIYAERARGRRSIQGRPMDQGKTS